MHLRCYNSAGNFINIPSRLVPVTTLPIVSSGLVHIIRFTFTFTNTCTFTCTCRLINVNRLRLLKPELRSADCPVSTLFLLLRLWNCPELPVRRMAVLLRSLRTCFVGWGDFLMHTGTTQLNHLNSMHCNLPSHLQQPNPIQLPAHESR